jgi:hypothetical protein
MTLGTLRTLGTGALRTDRGIPRRRRRMPHPGPPSVIVLASAESTGDANRHGISVHDDDGVHAVGLAGAAVILERLAGSIRAGCRHGNP